MKTTAMMTALILALAACDGGNKSSGSGTTKTTSVAGSASGASTAAGELSDDAVDAMDVPTEEDFEAEAEKDITDENYMDELDKMGKEIEEDKS